MSLKKTLFTQQFMKWKQKRAIDELDKPAFCNCFSSRYWINAIKNHLLSSAGLEFYLL